MPEERLHACIYRVLRYTPNLVRDEWVNIGILIHDPTLKRLRVRLIEELNEFARLRRLHPSADENLLRALQAGLEAQVSEHIDDLPGYIAKLDQTLSNVLQLSPQKGVLTDDLEGELDRLYHDHVEPPRYRGTAAETANTRHGIRTRITQVFRSAGILPRMERGVRIDEFTYRGDPLRLDYSYRRNGTRGFVHALALSRDPAQAKVLAYTAGCIRAKLASSEFFAITEVEPRPLENDRHRFVLGLLADKDIPLVPVSELEELAKRLGPTLR
jgi:hypothetical protein